MLENFGIFPIQDGEQYERNQVSARTFSVFNDVSSIIEPKIILEVGSWEGASALAWLNATGNDSKLICVDTWLGSIEHYASGGNGEWGRDRLHIEDGYPSIYKTFVSNIRREAFFNRVYTVTLDSRQALMLIKDAGVVPDVCYIDGAHDYDSVYSDVSGCFNLGPKIICGDDYYVDISPQIKRAVDDFAEHNSLKVVSKENQFAMFSEEDIYNKLIERGWQ